MLIGKGKEVGCIDVLLQCEPSRFQRNFDLGEPAEEEAVHDCIEQLHDMVYPFGSEGQVTIDLSFGQLVV